LTQSPPQRRLPLASSRNSLLAVALGLIGFFGNSRAAERVESPDGRVAITFALQENGTPTYTITYRGKPVVLESRLGLEPALLAGFELTGTRANERHGEWKPVWGERAAIPDNFHELVVDLRQTTSGRALQITFRAYDEGAALRYTLPGDKPLTISGERSEFRFPAGTLGYEEHGTEGDYQRVPVGDIQPWCERPLTLEVPSGFFASLGEAANVDYPRMQLSPLPGAANALVSALGGTSSNLDRGSEFLQRQNSSATLPPGASTPWRFFILGDKPGDLLERNFLVQNLNPPCALADTAWIKPGKMMRDMSLTTAGSKAIIDFAAAAGLRYLLLDWKWYGTFDATRARAPDLDLPEVIAYGRKKGVGLVLYVDRRDMKLQRDILFPLYEKWGVAGVKIGFVPVGPQEETAWITETIRKAAEHHLLLNIHDGYRSTGLERTYPNLLTVEGIQGNEHMPEPEHNCTLPFTRYPQGFGDYTVCYYSPRIRTTHAHQLAMAVISYSPLQALFWYDAASDYDGEPEIEFFRRVPTTWDETRVLAGRIGEYAALARRSGDEWFLGVVNDSHPRTLRVSLDFLPTGKRFTARLFADDPLAPTRTKVAIRDQRVDAGTTLELPLQGAGGAAIWIAPAK
jgi:alpha-glucosidase